MLASLTFCITILIVCLDEMGQKKQRNDILDQIIQEMLEAIAIVEHFDDTGMCSFSQNYHVQ